MLTHSGSPVNFVANATAELEKPRVEQAAVRISRRLHSRRLHNRNLQLRRLQSRKLLSRKSVPLFIRMRLRTTTRVGVWGTPTPSRSRTLLRLGPKQTKLVHGTVRRLSRALGTLWISQWSQQQNRLQCRRPMRARQPRLLHPRWHHRRLQRASSTTLRKSPTNSRWPTLQPYTSW